MASDSKEERSADDRLEAEVALSLAVAQAEADSEAVPANAERAAESAHWGARCSAVQFPDELGQPVRVRQAEGWAMARCLEAEQSQASARPGRAAALSLEAKTAFLNHSAARFLA